MSAALSARSPLTPTLSEIQAPVHDRLAHVGDELRRIVTAQLPLIDEVKAAMAGLLAPIKREQAMGRLEVRNTFTVPKVGTVAGCMVVDGKITRKSLLRLVRDSVQVYEGRVASLRRFKDDASEVQTGYECGVMIAGYNDIKVGDVIETYEVIEEAATL